MITWKELQELSIMRRAKDLVWETLAETKRQEYLTIATQQEQERLKELAIKCWNDSAVMEDPNYVSRADPNAYLPIEKKAKKNKKVSKKRAK